MNTDKDVLFSSPIIVKHIKDYLQECGLSKRESEVVILVVQGLTNKQVADRLCVAEKTVKFHLTNVYKRMKISRRSQIIWTLPMAQFIEQAKDVEPIIPQNNETNNNTHQVDDNFIPIGNSTVTDGLDNF